MPDCKLRVAASGVILAAAALTASQTPASAASFTDIYSFCSQANCADGNYAAAPLVEDQAGHFYGTAALGGNAGWGTIFELVPGKSGYKFKVLHSFCAQANCTDGSDPVAGLVIDAKGNLYGTTKFGGANNGGTVFELQRRGAVFNVLHSFCAQGAPCADGSSPVYDGLTYAGAATGAPYDGKSPLYGTTIYGSENNGGYAGVVYAMKRHHGVWKEKVVYPFCSQANCADGSQPQNGLTIDASGNIYGVTYGGGVEGDGAVFALTPGKSGFTQSVLYSFCTQANCADGSNPQSPLALDASGNLYGTTTGGGAGNSGVAFAVAPNGGNANFKLLYSFCSQGNCADGANPSGRLAFDASGNIFGTTVAGGDPTVSRGVLYELSGGKEQVLHTFCQGGNCSDGMWPVGGVILNSSNSVFGTTSEGGAHSDGAVFAFKP